MQNYQESDAKVNALGTVSKHVFIFWDDLEKSESSDWENNKEKKGDLNWAR